MKDREQRFEELYEENMHRWRQLCFIYASDKELAEDLFQEALLNIWQNMESFRGESRITTWAYRIIVNTALLFNRKLTSRYNNQRKYLEEENSQLATRIDANDKSDLLYRMVDRLDERDKIIITLILEGLSYPEISEITGLTKNYIAVKFNRAKKQMKKKLNKDEG